jgi:hypothetical protein
VGITRNRLWMESRIVCSGRYATNLSTTANL